MKRSIYYILLTATAGLVLSCSPVPTSHFPKGKKRGCNSCSDPDKQRQGSLQQKHQGVIFRMG